MRIPVELDMSKDDHDKIEFKETYLNFIIDENKKIRLLQINKVIEKDYVNNSILYDRVLFITKYIYDIQNNGSIIDYDLIRKKLIDVKNEEEFRNVIRMIISMNYFLLKITMPIVRTGYLLSESYKIPSSTIIYDSGKLEDFDKNGDIVFYETIINTDDLFSDSMHDSDLIPHPSEYYSHSLDNIDIERLKMDKYHIPLSSIIVNKPNWKLYRINNTSGLELVNKSNIMNNDNLTESIIFQLNSYLECYMVKLDMLFSQTCINTICLIFDKNYCFTNLVELKEVKYNNNEKSKKEMVMDTKRIIEKLREFYNDIFNIIVNELNSDKLHTINLYFYNDEVQTRITFEIESNNFLEKDGSPINYEFKYVRDKIQTVENYLDYFNKI